MTLRTFAFNKLIRDKMYEAIRNKGAKVNLLKINSRQELIQCFKNKLLEEIQEVHDAKNDIELTEELVDCVEVINGFLKALNVSKDEFEKIRQNKYNSRGGFNLPIMVKSVSVSSLDTDPDYYEFLVNYCTAHTLKYPEITDKNQGNNVEENVS